MITLAIFFPILSIAINLTVARAWRAPAAGIIASGAAGLAFLVSALQFGTLLMNPQPLTIPLAQWIQVGGFSVDAASRIKKLSVTMMLLVTGIGTLIHVYAIGYMQGDPRFTRFFIYLNLFLVAMLVLVTANNYLVLFAGWEGVGLCSFLLIGFWFDKSGEGTQISNAARKAFIVNRIGDAGLLIALLLIATRFGTLDFVPIFEAARTTFAVGTPAVTAITLLLFVGVTGKSAQIPLYVWLPDAMVGPTPVSALIHAATMVTAGVYLIIRSHILFDLAPLTQTIVTITGTATALLAATVAVSQFDIKRVLAFSTISQLGFMITAVGMGAYAAGLFHLITHAFFKALLFLAVGSILHAIDTQDARRMGGLRRMRITFVVYLTGALALAGLPPLSGFFSKDEILATAYEQSMILYLVLAAAGFLTAFYIARQVFLIFMGNSRSDAARDAHESKPLLIYPLIALAVGAILGSVINLPGSAFLEHWLADTTGEIESTPFNFPVAALSILIALAGIALAYALYHKYRAVDPLEGRLFAASSKNWRIDDLYHAVIIQPFERLTGWLAAADSVVSYGLDRAAVRMSQGSSDWLRKFQTGQLNWNTAGVIVGLIVVLLIVIVGRGL